VKRRVLITRAADQAGEFADHLKRVGFEPLIFPVIEFAPPKDSIIWEMSFSQLSSYDWILLTSANAVRYFIESLEERGINISDLKSIPLCVVGPKTAEVAKKAGLVIDLMPVDFQAEGVLHAFKALGVQGKRILFPRAEEGRQVLPEGLKSLGARVRLVPVYRTVKPEGKEEELKSLLSKGIDVISFTSGSTVRNFLDILGRENLDLLAGVKIACISEVTAGVAAENGMNSDIIPVKNTTLSLAEAIKKHFI